MTEKQKSKIKFPENLKVKSKLQTGDREIIAEKAGYKLSTVRDMLNGYRMLTDAVKQAIIDLLHDREKLNATLDAITSTGASVTHQKVMESLLLDREPGQ